MPAEMFPTRARYTPVYYVVVTCAVSVVALLTLRGDDHRRELRD